MSTAIQQIKLSKSDHGKDANDRRADPMLLPEIDRKMVEAWSEDQEKEWDAFPFIFADEIEEIQSAPQRIQDYVEDAGITLLYAKKDMLKSFLAIDWALSIASGLGWHGFEVKQGAVAYIAGEGNEGLKRRSKAWAIHHNVNLKTLPIALSRFPMQVLDRANILEWADYIQAVADKYQQAIGLVVIDTLATNFGPGEENSSTDMARFLAHLKIHIQSRFNCAVLVVHHTGKDESKGGRGGYAIEANSDAVFELKRQGDPDDQSITLVCKHIKDTEKPPELNLVARVVELPDLDRHGFPLTSLVLDLELSQAEQAVLNQTMAGRSVRLIAESVGISKSKVSRTQTRLRAMNKLPKASQP